MAHLEGVEIKITAQELIDLPEEEIKKLEEERRRRIAEGIR